LVIFIGGNGWPQRKKGELFLKTGIVSATRSKAESGTTLQDRRLSGTADRAIRDDLSVS